MWLRMKAITDHEQFKVVCLNKDVLYTALVMMNTIRKFTATQQVIIAIMSCSYIKHYAYFIDRTDWQPVDSLFTGHSKNLAKEPEKLYLLVLL